MQQGAKPRNEAIDFVTALQIQPELPG